MAGLTLACTLSGTAPAQQPGPLEIYQAPVIVGNPYIGATLNVSGGAWRSPQPSRTEAHWEWWRCPGTQPSWRCDVVHRGIRDEPTPYTVAARDRNEYLFLIRYIRWRDSDGDWVPRWRISSPVGPVTNAPPPPPPAPTPAPTPVPTVAPTPTPTFDTSTPAAPVGTMGPILTDTPSYRRAIRPFPVVRMRGRLTRTGARVSVLSVRAPRSAKVVVRCKGRSCPKARWAPDRRKKKLTRVRRFERSLRSGTRISVTVSRKRYIGKRTIFVIRRGRAPSRVDNCINSRYRVTRCPAGV
jgi:hypothetical protein